MLWSQVPFWPECLHVKFQKICLCKAICCTFEIRFRKINICNVTFYLRQIKFSGIQICNFVGGPKSNVLAEALRPRNILCDAILDTLFFPQFGPCIAPRILDVSQNLAFSDAKFPTFLSHFWPCAKTCWVSTGFPLLMQDFLHFSTFLALLHQKMSLGFRRIFRLLMQISTIPQFWPHCTQELLGFQDFPLLMQDFHKSSTFLALLHQESFNFHRIFLLWCNISHVRMQTHTHTHAHHGSSRTCKNLQKFWPKTIFVCKAIFYIFKNKSTRIYLCKATFYLFGNYSP